MKKPVITIDGPSGVGKGTLALSLTKKLGFTYLDTGAQYRAVTLKFLRSGKKYTEEILIKIAESLTPENLISLFQDPELRSPKTSQWVSKVAKVKDVRKALTLISQKFTEFPPKNAKGVILDGRDTGTLVCPSAEVKFYLTANPKVRAKRRWLDYQQKGKNRAFEDVLNEVSERDKLDGENPLIPDPTPETIHLDSSNLNRQEVLDLALKYINQKLKI
ncbi:MAG: (d)CMP kinase [Alphaproteobacteria bacterium]